MSIASVSKMCGIVLCNYPIYMNNLEELQTNWNIVENIVDQVLTVEVYQNCLSVSPIMDLFIPWNQNWSSSQDIDSFISLNFDSVKEKFKVYLKNLFAKTNKVLIKITQNYPEKERLKTFSMFTEGICKKLFDAANLEDLMKVINKNFDPLFLMMTSARANIWKDDSYLVPATSFNFQQWNVEFASVIFMNSLFSYYGSFSEEGGKCFKIMFNSNVSFDLWDRKTFREPNIYGDLYTIATEESTTTFKNGTIELKKYSNPTAIVSELLLNNQNPFDVDYETIPTMTCELYSFSDIQQYVEDYRKQSNRNWLTFADILIGFDDNDTFTNQTFKRSIYNAIMRKVCNWTLFIPLNTFFDCSNINQIHENLKISIKPSDLGKYNDIKPEIKKLNMDDLSETLKELHTAATESKSLGGTLKINTMAMSNPPTEAEIARYNEIKKQLP